LAGVQVHFIVELPVAFGELNETVGLRVGKWAKKHSVNNGEDGAVRTNAESKCQDGDYGEGSRLGENAQAVSNVLEKMGHLITAEEHETNTWSLSRSESLTEQFPLNTNSSRSAT
jgi:hypothetical protein